MTPHKWLALAFLIAIVAGAGILSLPGMTVAGTLSPVDALFTATSAICVTGLTVLDTGQDFTLAGQVVILVLIQLGGIGIVTAASLLILAGSERLSIGHEDTMNLAMASRGRISASRLAVTVVSFTLVIEALGVLALLPFWSAEGAPGQRLWQCVFHAVSAFCNAGFSLLPANLEPMSGNAGASCVIMVLIVLGGFGFLNLAELAGHARARSLRWENFSLLLKVSVVYTPVLIVAGAFLLWLVERRLGFADLGTGDAVIAAFFHSVSARTAGFHTVPLAEFTELSLIVIALLMWIGGVSGSCAGGIKVNTLAVLGAMVRAQIRNDAEPSLFRRSVTRTAQRSAVVLLVASLLTMAVAAFALSVFEGGLVAHRSASRDFFGQGFEVMSALGTVGLSTGITNGLDVGGKLLLIVLMLVGRLGPLAVIAAWAKPSKPRPFKHPEELLPVG
jgi:trk system potassium uptake protein TrkH